MSFILDALRKSESERQREAAASLSRAPHAIVRNRVPIWTWLLIGGLLVALVALLTAWWGSAERDIPTAGQSVPVTAIGATSEIEIQASPIPEPVAVVPPRLRSIGELATFDASLPTYRLELLAFDSQNPAAGSAWINGRRYFIGEQIVGGPDLVEVRSDGVVLAYAGEHFLLTTR
jgi:hypothetical protein